MKLSEAIMLGSTAVSPQAFVFIEELKDGSYHGCALGMAAFAMGRVGDFSAYDVPDLDVQYPCKCFGISNFANVIVHLFDSHVASAPHDWSLERLVDWVRSVEPEETPEPTSTKTDTSTFSASDKTGGQLQEQRNHGVSSVK